MTAKAVEICDAVAAHLVATVYPFGFTVLRRNVGFVQLEQTNATRVYVYPQNVSSGLHTRDDFSREYLINVHITNFLDDRDQSEIDDALELAELIEQSLENVEMAGFQMMRFESDTGGRAMFEVSSVMDSNYFHVVIGVSYVGVL